jgi:hypothetical protein
VYEDIRFKQKMFQSTMMSSMDKIFEYHINPSLDAKSSIVQYIVDTCSSSSSLSLIQLLHMIQLKMTAAFFNLDLLLHRSCCGCIDESTTGRSPKGNCTSRCTTPTSLSFVFVSSFLWEEACLVFLGEVERRVSAGQKYPAGGHSHSRRCRHPVQ